MNEYYIDGCAYISESKTIPYFSFDLSFDILSETSENIKNIRRDYCGISKKEDESK